jgi:hypothetical protein
MAIICSTYNSVGVTNFYQLVTVLGLARQMDAFAQLAPRHAP